MQIRQLSSNPAMYLIDDFLNADECQQLIDIALASHLVASEVQVTQSTKGNINTQIRDSKQVFIDQKKNKLTMKIFNRMNKLVKMPLSLAEPLQIARYEKGGYFKHHYDFTIDNIADRLATFMVYLNDVGEGGETEFPYLGFRIIPRRGRALLWYNYAPLKLPQQTKGNKKIKIPLTLTAHLDLLHAGVPVRQGEKWITTQWYSIKKKYGRIHKNTQEMSSRCWTRHLINST